MFNPYFNLTKQTLTTILTATTLVLSQGDIYPTENNYGGGIGFSAMYMVLDTVPGGTLLNNLGFDVDELGTKPLVFYGGEGFAQMSGPWRLGGYAGIGFAQASNVYQIAMYADRDKTPGYQEPTFGNEATGDTLYTFSDNLALKARLNFLMGAMKTHQLIPKSLLFSHQSNLKLTDKHLPQLEFHTFQKF